MADIDVAAAALTEMEQPRRVAAVSRSTSREIWISFAAASAVMLIVGSLLVAVTAELRAGWVSGHELPMDKAKSIHNLFFRS